MRSTSARMRSGVFWSFLATAANQGSTLVVTILISRTLGREANGAFVAMLSTAMFLATAGLLGTGLTATKFLAEWRDSRPDDARATFAYLNQMRGHSLWLLLMIGLACTWPIFDLPVPIIVGAILAFGLNGWLFYSAVLQGFEEFRSVALCAAIGGVSWIVMALAFVSLDRSGPLLGVAIAGFIQYFVCFLFARKLNLPTIVIDRETGKEVPPPPEVKRFLLPVALTSFVSPVAIWLVNMIAFGSTNGKSELALLGVAMLLRQIVMVLPQNVYTAGVTVLNHLKGSGDHAAFRAGIWANLRSGLLLVAVGGALLYSVAPWVLQIWGSGYGSARMVLGILLISAVFEVLAQSLYQVVQAQAKMWHSLLLILIPWSLTLVVVSALLVPTLGAAGVAWGFVAAWFVSFIMSAILALRFAHPL